MCDPCKEEDMPPISNELRDSKLFEAEKHSIKLNASEDEESYNGTISVFKDGRVIICNYEGEHLYLYNPTNKTALKLKLDSGEVAPYSAVQIDDTHLAVSSGEYNTISIVSVGNELREEKTFPTKNSPHTIVALNNGQLAVAWNDPPAFGVVDISGTELVQKSCLEQDTSGRKFKSFEYMAVDESRQHVIQPCNEPCDEDKAVYCFDFTGKPVFKYTLPVLGRLQGVALDKCGNIYVCEYKKSGIFKLSPTGELLSMTSRGVPIGPIDICSDVTGTGFWVTRDSQSAVCKIVHLELQGVEEVEEDSEEDSEED